MNSERTAQLQVALASYDLKERCLRKELPLRGSFPIDAVDAAYRSYLAQETFV